MGYASHVVPFQQLHWARDPSGSKNCKSDGYLSHLKFPFAKPVTISACSPDRMSAMDMGDAGTGPAVVLLQLVEGTRYGQRPASRP